MLEVDEVYLPRVLTRDRGGRRRAAQPVARPARPHERGAHGGGSLAGGAGGGAARPCRRERRRPAGGLGGRRGARRALGGRRGCAGSSTRWAARRATGASRSARASWSCCGCGFAGPLPSRRVDAAPAADGARADGVWADGRQPRSAWRCPGGSTRPTRSWPPSRPRRAASTRSTALEAMAAVEEVAGRFTVRSFGTCGRGSCWPRTRRAGTSCSTWWPGDAPLVVSINARVADGARPQLAVGRALRAAGGSLGGGDRGPLPRPLGPAALRRGRPPHRGGPGGPSVAVKLLAVGGASGSGGWRRRRHRELHGLPRPARGRIGTVRRLPCGWRWCTPTSSGPTATAATG